MLVLSRKAGEKVVIDGGTIVVEVLEIRGDKVRLGFTAPPQISLHREEVAEAIAAGTRTVGVRSGNRSSM